MRALESAHRRACEADRQPPFTIGLFATPVSSNGGIARWLIETRSSLLELGFEVPMLIGTRPGVTLRDPDLRAASYCVDRLGYVTQLSRFRRWVRLRSPDLVVTALPQAALLTRQPRLAVPVVATIHGHPPPSWRGLVYRATFRRLATEPDTVVTVASRLHRSWGLPAETACVTNSVRPASGPEVVKRPGTVAYAGRLEPEKGIDELLRLAGASPDLQFHIAGAGSLQVQVEQAAASYPNVTFHGWIDDIRAFLAPMEFSLFPAPAEGLPYALLDSLAMGCRPLVRSADLGSELGLGVADLVDPTRALSTALATARSLDPGTLAARYSREHTRQQLLALVDAHRYRSSRG